MGDGEGGDRLGEVTINWVEGDIGGKHNNYFALDPGANLRPSTACLAPKHNNKQQSSSFVVVNERKARPFATDVQNKQQSAEEGGGKFNCCLVLLVFIVIILILSPNFTSYSTII